MLDLLEAVAGEQRYIGTELPLDREVRRARYLEDLESADAESFVATSDGRIIGVLGVRGTGVADLGMLVHSRWRGRGVGSALLRAAIDWARGNGAHKIALQVWPHNEAALKLYEKFGFEREGHLHRHYRRRNGELWDAIVMGLPIRENQAPQPSETPGSCGTV